jgi:hypothetical protein
MRVSFIFFRNIWDFPICGHFIVYHSPKLVVVEMFQRILGKQCKQYAWFGWWCLSSLSTTFHFFVVICFIGGGNRSTQRKQPTCCKSLTIFITYCCIENTSPWKRFELTTVVVISTDSTYIVNPTIIQSRPRLLNNEF